MKQERWLKSSGAFRLSTVTAALRVMGLSDDELGDLLCPPGGRARMHLAHGSSLVLQLLVVYQP